MRFKEFLAESNHKQEIPIEEVENLLNEHCKDAMKLFHRPIWRGMTSGEDAYILHGEAGGRESANTSNYYTVIMDKFLPYFGYPKRGKSIICGNDENKSYASSFGSLYAIFPYDGVSIGVCQGEDLWDTMVTIGKCPQRRSIDGWNRFFSTQDLNPYSWEDFKSSLESAMEDNDDLLEWFGPPEKIDDVFRKAYGTENLQLELTDSANVDKIRGRHELWIGGKCIAIEAGVHRQMLKEKGLL